MSRSLRPPSTSVTAAHHLPLADNGHGSRRRSIQIEKRWPNKLGLCISRTTAIDQRATAVRWPLGSWSKSDVVFIKPEEQHIHWRHVLVMCIHARIRLYIQYLDKWTFRNYDKKVPLLDFSVQACRRGSVCSASNICNHGDKNHFAPEVKHQGVKRELELQHQSVA